jgi:response regulator RpfG family c-di-GMP phosphodiesterase
MEQKARILITDDEQGVRETFQMMLKEDYEVLSAETGRECLEIVNQKPPHLVILDLCLPDMDGLEVLNEIKRINGSLPVIMITGLETHRTAIEVEAMKLGAEHCIAKPINLYYVRTIVASVFSVKKPGEEASADALSEDSIARNYIASLKALTKALEARDPLMHEHSKKVSEYAVLIARELGLSSDEQDIIGETALLHDIGKIGITDFILKKPHRLNSREWTEIKKHPQIGEGFLLGPLQVVHVDQSMVRHHHERYDGKGYPDHLKGERIPLYARILCVADSYEAMISERPYRHALTPIEALTELQRCSGTQFDPGIIKIFAEVLRKKHLCEKQAKETTNLANRKGGK